MKRYPHRRRAARVRTTIGLSLWLIFLRPALPDTVLRQAHQVCGTSAARTSDAVARARYEESRFKRGDALRAPQLFEPRAASRDVGDVAVIGDDGTLITQPNAFDLVGRSFRFEPGSSSAYRIVASASALSTAGGTALRLDDDDSAAVNLGFAFPFFGQNHPSVQVNSDGNLTFTQADTASTDRDLGRFYSGPPRIGPFFADLDPSRAGSVSVRNEPDGIAFVWNAVPEFSDGPPTRFNSFGVKLFRSGEIEFAYGSIVQSRQAVVGISPGERAGGIVSVDFTNALPTLPLAGTIAEVFAGQATLSESAITQRFFETHPDRFDLITVFLGFNYDLGGGAYAYEINVKNEIRGIGLAVQDSSAFFGSAGRLRSFLNMGTLSGLGRYPDNPNQVFLGTNSTVSIMGQESGHRWLVFTPFLDGSRTSNAILGRDLAHWSFFFNSAGSVMEGNQIQDRGPERGLDRFLTTTATYTFSPFDLYIMGLLGRESVAGSFLVENPVGTSRQPSSAPQSGILFGGTRKDVTMDQIIAANGVRVPSVDAAPKVFRQAFVYLTARGETADPAQVQKVQNIRDAWVRFFSEQTGRRGWVVTDLQDTPATTPSALLFPFLRGSAQRYTGVALANGGTAPADVLLTAFANDGRALSSPAHIVNPRMITIAPGRQAALTAEQIHGLGLQDERNGWIRAESTSSHVTGFFVDGDVAQNFLTGASAATETGTTLFFPRAQLASGISAANDYRNLVNLVNPDASTAVAELTLFGAGGAPEATATRTIPGLGRVAEDLSRVFPGAAIPRAGGYVRVTCSTGLAGYQSIDTGTTLFSLPAVAPSSSLRLYSPQFASGRAGNAFYFSDVNLINTSAAAREVEILLVGDDGRPAASPVNPVRRRLQPGEQLRARGEELFGLPAASLGGVLVQGSLVITSDGAGIVGDITFGDPLAGRYLAGLPLDPLPQSRFVLSHVAQGRAGGTKPYFTGLAIFNPGVDAVEVLVEVFAENGSLTGSSRIPMAPGARFARTLPEIVPAASEQIRGHIRLTVIGGVVSACGLFGDQSLTFLTAVPAQPVRR